MRKFERSQAAHRRLFNKHSAKKRFERNRRLASYHMDVYNTQLSRGKVLSWDERKKKYRGWVKN